MRLSLFQAIDWLVTTDRGADLAQDVARGMLAAGRDVQGLGVRGQAAAVEAPVDRFDAAVVARMNQVRDNANPHYGAWDPGQRYVSTGGTLGLPAALVQTLAQAADADGFVDSQRARALLGEKAGSLVEAIAAGATQPSRRLSANAKRKWHAFTDVDTQRLVARSMGKDTLRAQMPALRMVEEQLGGSRPLKNVRVAAIQHLFPTTASLMESLRACGAAHVSVLGKPYSSDPDVVRALDARGFAVHESGSEQEGVVVETRDPRGQGGTRETITRDAFIARWLGEELGALQPGQKLLLLDDGARMVRALQQHYPNEAHRCIAVEQTMRGVQVIESEVGAVSCPIVDVARSDAKKQQESPMIGESVTASIEAMISEANPHLVVDPKEALVLGYGAVGKEVAASLQRRGYVVHVWDTDETKRAAAAKDGCTVDATRDDALIHGHLVVGCTGRGSLAWDEYDRLPDGAVLANAASDDHELGCNVDAFRALRSAGSVKNDMSRWSKIGALEVKVGDATLPDPTRSHVVATTPSGKQQLVLCSGYVVNMARDIPPSFIQLTRALLLAACLQATQESDPGLRPLAPRVQRKIVDAVEQDLAGQGLSLQRPDFRALAGEAPVFEPRQFESAPLRASLLVRMLGGGEPGVLSAKGFFTEDVMVWELETMASEAMMMWLDYEHPPADRARLEAAARALASSSPAAQRLLDARAPQDGGDWVLARMELELMVVRERAAKKPALLTRVDAVARELAALPAKRIADRTRVAGAA